MSWNYRVVVEDLGEHGTAYSIREVYYDDDGKPRAWSGQDFNPVSMWEELDDLKGTVKLLQGALDKPVLTVVGEKLVEP
ncbi:hypothetical protein [Mycolicibacterium septicum]|uniref:hypothetical protein n=1 Tax=Mycolicibacterium septicum TaxID=98668 RepID=UPI001AFADCD3|nr:hypothetical protein [Mycolicibacterium septicum]QRY51706.1 hypothetical protein JVX95_30745 [Mycolicibacterium septicum]